MPVQTVLVQWRQARVVRQELPTTAACPLRSPRIALQILQLWRVARFLHCLLGQWKTLTESSYAMLDRLENELRPQRLALNLRGFRQELLASNIANADTPHYKARDIDFKSAFADALAGRNDGGLGMARTSTKHLPGAEESPYSGALRYRSEYQSAVDGNTVNMDIERAAFAENAVHMEAMLTFISGRFRTLASAVQGQ